MKVFLNREDYAAYLAEWTWFTWSIKIPQVVPTFLSFMITRQGAVGLERIEDFVDETDHSVCWLHFGTDEQAIKFKLSHVVPVCE